ncbi:MAG: YicC family protein [Candidatus Aminicenantes bacterium]|nr:YicC family protein [Candidatus Aminicenantes bacterium]
MICSMTGFGEKSISTESLSVKIGIKTLNHRFFDWNFHGPAVGDLEDRLRSICQEKITRGRVDVFFDLFFQDSMGWKVLVNEDLFQKVFRAVDKMSARTGKDIHLALDNVFSIPYIVEISKRSLRKEEKEFLESHFRKVLDVVLKSRRREGFALEKELRLRIRNMKSILIDLEKAAGLQPVKIREKLIQRIKELNGGGGISEDKLMEETAYYAQRYDLAEEIARLKSHLTYAGELLSPQKEGPAGKKLDFISQELFRETNTINSKSQDIEITRICLTMKGEIESLRQQVQNIE